MPKIICSLCGKEMIIDEIEGEPYIKEADGTIHHVICPEEESAEGTPSETAEQVQKTEGETG